MGKGQASLEFVAMIGFLMLIFTVFVTTFADKEIRTVNREVGLFAKSVADRVAFELDLAWLQEKGFTRTFTVPETIAAADYTINVTGNTVSVTWEDTRVLSDTVAPVHGNITPGENTVRNNGTHLVTQ